MFGDYCRIYPYFIVRFAFDRSIKSALVSCACNGFECVEVNGDGHTRVQNVIIPMKTLLRGICSMGGGRRVSSDVLH